MAEFLYSHSSLIIAVFFAAAAVCICLYSLFFGLALRPKQGTLEWIALYDRPGLQLSGQRARLRAYDLPLAVGAALLCGAVYCLGIFLQLRSFELFQSPQNLVMLLTGAAVVGMSAAGGYFLLKSLFGSLWLAFAGAMLFGLDLGADYAAAALLVWGLLFLHRWMTADFEQKARRSLPSLILLALTLSLCANMALDLGPMIFLMMIAVVLVAVLRLKRTHRLDRFGGFFGSLSVFFLVFFAGTLAVQALLTLRSGNPDALRNPALYLHALFSWMLAYGDAFSIPLITPAFNLCLFALGLVGTLFSLHDLRRHGRHQGLTLLFAMLAGVLTASLCGVYVLLTAAIPGAVYTFARAKERGKPGLMAAGLIGAFVTTLIYDLILMGII